MTVATALTVYGIETLLNYMNFLYFLTVATALTVYGIETIKLNQNKSHHIVATALTVYGIETVGEV